MSSFGFSLFGPLGGDTPAPASAVVTVDHVRTGLSRLWLQFRSANPMDEPTSRTNMEKLLAILLAPLNDLELALQQLLQLRSLPVAIGIYLDAIGKLVGQPRGGLDDDDYRRFLYVRIATNRSEGRRSDLIKIAKLILADSAATIIVELTGPAAATITIAGVTVTDGRAAIVRGFLAEAAAAGVRIGLLSSPEPLADQFAFPLAAFADGAATATATSITVDSTAGFPAIGTLQIDIGLAVEETVHYAGLTSTTFTLTAPLAHNHTDGAAVQLEEPSTGDGFGDSAEGENLVDYSVVGSTGGMLVDIRESVSA